MNPASHEPEVKSNKRGRSLSTAEVLMTNAKGTLVKDPFLTAIDLRADCTTEDLRTGLLQFYICYCPSQLLQIPKLISKFRTVGKQALAETQKRFNQMPLPGEVHAVLRTCPRTRLFVYYAFYAPAKFASVDDLLCKYSGQEDALWESLIAKYGPEKPPQLLFDDWEEREVAEKMSSANDSGNRFRRSASIVDPGSSFSLDRSIVFSTENIEGKQTLWHRDPEQVARDFARSRDDDSSSLDSSGRHASFAAFSPLSFSQAYPDSVMRRAQSIMLREDESPEEVQSPQVASPSSPSRAALDPEEISLILRAANVDSSTVCPIGGRAGTQLPLLPEELSPKSVEDNNRSFSPRTLRRRQSIVSFVLGNEKDAQALLSPVTPHHPNPGSAPPSALIDRSQPMPPALSLPASQRTSSMSSQQLTKVSGDDFDKL